MGYNMDRHIILWMISQTHKLTNKLPGVEVVAGAGGAGWSYYYRRGLYLSAGHTNLHFTSDLF